MMIAKELQVAFNVAVQEALRRRHDLVCLEHVLLAILSDSAGSEILENCGADLDDLRIDLDEYLESLGCVPGHLSLEVEQTMAVTRVLQLAADHVLSAGKGEITVGDVLAAMYREEDSHAVNLLKSQGVTRLDILNYISHGVSKIADDHIFEEKSEAEDESDSDSDADAEVEGKRPSRNPLELFAVDLIQKAAEGRIDPLVGRKAELTRIVQILCRRRKNNPILVGEPGVGKTAIVEGLALAVCNNEVPDVLRNANLFLLDVGALVSGTKFRGEFEQRMKAVVAEIKKRPNSICFIDEIHTIVGAGAVSGGSLDASNLLKPSLANGELRCIGSTTYEDYKQIFERDKALARRFQKLDIEEPSREETYEILRGLKDKYEEHHEVTYSSQAIKAAVELADKHISHRHLPDKAIDVMDEAGAMARIARSSKRDCRKKMIRAKDIESVVAAMARIPPPSVSASDRDRLETLESDLKAVIFGQDQAVDSLTSAIKLSRSGLARPGRPIGSFLFAGPTGVGKTELARQLASILGVELIRFDMSEYMEGHSVARLIGAPPGYVGFDQGGLLTDSVIKSPHSVLILDEVEKAHPDILNVLLQVMDYATLTDHNGRKADFRNVILVMTTNAGARETSREAIGFGGGDLSSNAKAAIDRAFSPEFRNRLDALISFNSLSIEVMGRIVDKLMAELQVQLIAKKVGVDLSESARQWFIEKGFDKKNGARPMAGLIDKAIRRKLADQILFGELKSGGNVLIDEKDGELAFEFCPNSRKNEAGAKKLVH